MSLEFLLSISIGMHIGKYAADVLEKVFAHCGLLTAEQVKEIDIIEEIECDVCGLIDCGCGK